MPEVKKRHVDLMKEEPSEEGGTSALRCLASCHGQVEAECEEAGGMPLGHMMWCAVECG